MTDKEQYKIELLRARFTLAIKHTQTEFWKVGIACIIAGGALGALMGKFF